MRKIATFLALTFLFLTEAVAQGTINIALTQQFSFTGCTSTNVCGRPLAGGLLYFYQVGTVATPQDSFQDTGLTLKNPWPLQLDQNGRVPMFYLANGSIHVRLTDSGGLQQFDYPSMLVVGPSAGSGGGSAVDATSILSTGDIKFRATNEALTGWVKLNAQTIGNASSGATGRANADTQALYIYLWTNCNNAHCPVSTGRGASALADFNANKTLQVFDWRGRMPAGRDCMENSCLGILIPQNVTSGGGDTVDTATATGGFSNYTMSLVQLPNFSPNNSASFSATNNINYTPSGNVGTSITGTQNLSLHGSHNFALGGSVTPTLSGANTLHPFSGGTSNHFPAATSWTQGSAAGSSIFVPTGTGIADSTFTASTAIDLSWTTSGITGCPGAGTCQFTVSIVNGSSFGGTTVDLTNAAYSVDSVSGSNFALASGAFIATNSLSYTPQGTVSMTNGSINNNQTQSGTLAMPPFMLGSWYIKL